MTPSVSLSPVSSSGSSLKEARRTSVRLPRDEHHENSTTNMLTKTQEHVLTKTAPYTSILNLPVLVPTSHHITSLSLTLGKAQNRGEG